MNRKMQTETVRIDQDHCGRCLVCPSVCPFDAISIDEKTGEVRLEIEKCQVCGICSTACPASAIDTVYYNIDPLTRYIERKAKELGSDTLVLACQGTSSLGERTLKELGELQAHTYVSISVPCVGRVPPELLLKAVALSLKKIVVIPCEDNYCRFKDGSKIGTRRLRLIQNLLNELGFRPDILTVAKRLIKAHIDENICIGCGNCHYICPYDAITMETSKVPNLDPERCSGCGSCVAVCPALAIKLDGFEYETISDAIHRHRRLVPLMKARTKKPAILVMSCQWSEFSDPCSSGNDAFKNVVFEGLPCAGRVDTLHVLEAFRGGFDGVLVAACKKDECKLEGGNDMAEQRVSLLQKLLAEVNLQGRLEICFVSPRKVGDLGDHIRMFTEKVESLSRKEVAAI